MTSPVKRRQPQVTRRSKTPVAMKPTEGAGAETQWWTGNSKRWGRITRTWDFTYMRMTDSFQLHQIRHQRVYQENQQLTRTTIMAVADIEQSIQSWPLQTLSSPSLRHAICSSTRGSCTTATMEHNILAIRSTRINEYRCYPSTNMIGDFYGNAMTGSHQRWREQG